MCPLPPPCPPPRRFEEPSPPHTPSPIGGAQPHWRSLNVTKKQKQKLKGPQILPPPPSPPSPKI